MGGDWTADSVRWVEMLASICNVLDAFLPCMFGRPGGKKNEYVVRGRRKSGAYVLL